MTIFFPPDASETEAVKPRKRRWLRRSAAVVIALVVIGLASSAIYLGSVQHSFTRQVVPKELLPAPSTGEAAGSTDGDAQPADLDGEPMNYVMMGSDSRNTSDAGAGRSDTLMVMHLAKGFSAKTVANPAKFTGFIADLAKHLTLDKELTNAEIRTIGLSLRLTSKDVKSLQAPIAGFAKINGQSVDVVDPDDIKELAVALQTDNMVDYAANQ